MKRKSYSAARSLLSFLFPMAIVRALARVVVEVKPGWETFVLVFDIALTVTFIGVLAYTLYLMLHNIKVERYWKEETRILNASCERTLND